MTSTKEDFKRDLKLGEEYEKIFFKKLRENFNPTYSNGAKGYDIECEGIKFEVKADSYTKGNNRIAVEKWSNKRLNHPGWINYSDADILIYFISKTEYYWIDMIYLKEFVRVTEGLYAEKTASIANNPDAIIYSILITDLSEDKCKLKCV